MEKIFYDHLTWPEIKEMGMMREKAYETTLQLKDLLDPVPRQVRDKG